ncbi:hypothetical protein P4O66_013165, partial [Electrophorus voltai]
CGVVCLNVQLPRADRTPLRNVQNQMSTSPWQTPTKSASLKKNVSQNKNLCRLSGSVDDFAAITSTATDIRSSEDGTGSLNENQGNVTFKSFMCTGGDVELSADSVMSDESVVVGALTLEDCPHTFSVTTVMCEDTLYDMEKHVDHPYCSHASDEPSSESVTLDTEKKVRGVCSANHTDAAPDSAGSCQTEAVSASELEDITVKSFSCPGGEIEIADASLAQEESFNVIIGTLKEEFRSVEDESEILDEHAELTGFPGCCADHPYCRRELEPPAYAHSHAVCTLPVSCEATVVRDDDLTGCMRDLTFIETSTAERPLVVVQGDVKLKSLCCSGGDVELQNACGESQVSVLMKEFALVGDLQSSGSDTSEESTAVLSPGGKHADLVYSRSGHGDFHPPASEVTSTGSRLSSSSWECSEMEAPGLADGSQNLKSVVGSGVAVVQSSTELPEELFSSKESVWSLCSSLLHNSRNVAESANVLQGLADVDQPPSANGEQDIASEEPPVLRGPVVSDYPQMSSDNKEAFLDVGGSAESCLSQTTVSPAPDMPAGNFPAGSSNVEGQNADTETSATRDSALGLSGDPDTHADMEVLRSESACDWECDLVSLHTQLSSATVPDSLTPRNPALSRSIVEGHGGPASQSRLWPELLDSPIPPPQLNSTALRLSPAAGRRDKALLDLSAMGKGPLQQQLRQMAELLILASGKIAAPATPAPRGHGVEVAATPVEKHSACVWTTPVLQADGSTNTSARVEIVKDIDMSDACTSTDPLLWSVTPSSLESLSRSDLEQKLLTTLVMVEVLSQQLASSHAPCPRVCPAPSDLRDRLVQTDHTQLGQTETYRELYVSALERIQALEDDHETLGSLHQALHLLRGTMTSVKTEAAQTLCSLKQIESVVSDDQEILSKQVSEMKALYGRCVGSLRKMEKKTQVCLQKRDDMRRTMEEALHERHVVELNRTCVESLGAACILLRQKLEDHTAFSEELCRAQQLLQRTHAVLLRLQQRALAAVEQSRQHQAARDAAVQDRCQLESELEQTQCNLRDAHLHVADLNTQVTIMTSEMAVLREQLEEAEDERAQLQRKTTELSATVSSTLASYAFLEQALADETSKLQCSLHQSQEAMDKAASLQVTLQDSQQRVEKLEETLAQRDILLTQLHAEVEAQSLHLRRLSQVESELSSAQEMSEFLQAETEMSREQLAESENLLRSHLQGLRQRNLECEDLRVALEQLRLEQASLQEELDSTRAKARSMLLDQGDQLAQAVLDVCLLHQQLRSLTNTTHSAAAASTQISDPPGLSEAPQCPLQTPQQPCTSFLSSVMLALTEEQQCDTAPPAGPEEAGPRDLIGSIGSAFTHVAVAVPQNADDERCSGTLVQLLASLGEGVSDLQSAIQQLREHKDAELQSLQSENETNHSYPKMSVAWIRTALTFRCSSCNLQEALRAESDRRLVGEAELQQQVRRLKAQAEKDAQVLQQKVQDEKALRKLCSDLEETTQTVQKHRAENSELRREGVELRRTLQQSQVEVQALREELKRSANQSSSSTKELDDRIRLLKEMAVPITPPTPPRPRSNSCVLLQFCSSSVCPQVERLKVSLSEVEGSRSKLLDRAKRHQLVHSLNQSKLERELHLLDDMIEAVRQVSPSLDCQACETGPAPCTDMRG